MSDSKESKKTKPISFRLDESVIQSLEYEASKKDISVNLLVNNTLRNFVNWHATELSAGFISFPKTVLTRMADKLTEEEAKQIGKIHAETDMQDLILIFKGRYTIDDFFDMMDNWMKYNNIIYRHIVKNGKHNFIIQHDLNKNWSLCISEFFKSSIEFLTKSSIETIVTANTIAFVYDASKIIDY